MKRSVAARLGETRVVEGAEDVVLPAGGTAVEALEWLTPAICTALGSLHGAPPAVAEAVAQLLPFGSRAALRDLGIIRDGRPVDEHGHKSLTLTPFGYTVIAAAAARNAARPAAVEDWSVQDEQAEIAALSEG